MKKSTFLIFSIIILASIIRLFKFQNTLNMDTDQAMAYILANHILNYKHMLLVGPITTFWEVNILPPTYYYLVTFLFWLFRKEILVSLSFAFTGILSVYLIYLLSSEYFDKKTALLTSLLFSFSYSMVEYSREIWEPHLIPLFVILALYFLSLLIKKGKLIFYHLSVISFMISFMYISSFTIFLPYLFILFKALSEFLKSRKSAIFYLIFSVSAFFLLTYFPVLIFEAANRFPSLTYLGQALKGETRYFGALSYPDNVFFNITLFFESAFNGFNPYLIWPVVLLILFFLLKMRNNKSREACHIRDLTVFLIFPFVLSGFYQEEPEIYRYAALYPLFFLLIGYPLKYYLKQLQNYNRGKLLAIPVIFLAVFFIYSGVARLQQLIAGRSGRKEIQTEKTVRAILKEQENNQFNIFTITPYEYQNHHSTTYIYALEKILNRKIANLNNKGNWISQAYTPDEKPLYLICRDFRDYRHAVTSCLNYFLKFYQLQKTNQTLILDNTFIFKLINSGINEQ